MWQNGTYLKMKKILTLELFQKEARDFAKQLTRIEHKDIYGVTDGKAIGTYIEHAFQLHLEKKYHYHRGNSAKGIDLPELNVDIKVTSMRQPQSSCPFKSVRQKIYGLGYHLILFIYDKSDDKKLEQASLKLLHTIFIDKSKTADFRLTKTILQTLNSGGNEEDVFADLIESNLPIDEMESQYLAKEIVKNPPRLGFLTISNALQWRLQYKRIVEIAGEAEGINRL